MLFKKVFNYRNVFDIIQYPAGEPHVRLKSQFLEAMEGRWYRPFIVSPASDWDDLVTIRIGDQILKDNEIEATFVIPYMPFSRHDRKSDCLDSMPISMVKEILAPVHVLTIDPHSDVTGSWFPNYPQSEVVKLFEEKGIFGGDGIVVIPDAGATKKAYSWLNGREYVQCLKKRDFKTGKLSGFEILDPGLVHGRHVVIIDDICDAGGTFLGLAELLLSAGAASLRLGVTHGLFTKGLEELKKFFMWFYTLDTCHIPDGDVMFTVSTEKLIEEGSYF